MCGAPVHIECFWGHSLSPPQLLLTCVSMAKNRKKEKRRKKKKRKEKETPFIGTVIPLRVSLIPPPSPPPPFPLPLPPSPPLSSLPFLAFPPPVLALLLSPRLLPPSLLPPARQECKISFGILLLQTGEGYSICTVCSCVFNCYCQRNEGRVVRRWRGVW